MPCCFLLDAVVEFTGSVADSFIEFLFAPRSRIPIPCSRPPSGSNIPSPSPVSSQLPDSGNNGKAPTQRVIETLRDKVERLEDEVDYLRDTISQGMIILGKPSDDEVERPEFLGELWKALNKRDQLIAHNIVVTRTLQKEARALLGRNLQLRKENGILYEKAKFQGTRYVNFLDAPDSKYRELLNELADVKLQRESLVRQNRELLMSATQEKLTTLRLVRSAQDEKKKASRRSISTTPATLSCSCHKNSVAE